MIGRCHSWHLILMMVRNCGLHLANICDFTQDNQILDCLYCCSTVSHSFDHTLPFLYWTSYPLILLFIARHTKLVSFFDHQKFVWYMKFYLELSTFVWKTWRSYSITLLPVCWPHFKLVLSYSNQIASCSSYWLLFPASNCESSKYLTFICNPFIILHFNTSNFEFLIFLCVTGWHSFFSFRLQICLDCLVRAVF